MYEYSKMNLSGTDINVKDSTARESAGSAKTEAENASGIATEALTTVREHSVKFASLEATTAAQGVDITTLKSRVGTGTLNTAASTLIPAVNEINDGLTNYISSVSYTGTTNTEGNIEGGVDSVFGLPRNAVILSVYFERGSYSTRRTVNYYMYGNAGIGFQFLNNGTPVANGEVTAKIYYVVKK